MTRTRLFLLLTLALSTFARVGSAEIKTKTIEYKQGGRTLVGFAAWDDAVAGKRPGILVVHEWWGHNQHARDQAIRLAKGGYVGFALDMFGKGKVATHPKEAQQFVAEVHKNAGTAKARFDAARKELEKLPQVDREKIGAIGYCFGGSVVLDVARAGEDLDVVATFHGALQTKTPAKKNGVKPRILVMTGGADPMVGPADVEGFKKEMTEAGARFTVAVYPGAKHAFTNPDADKAGVPGLAYDAKADQESWKALLALLAEVFPRA